MNHEMELVLETVVLAVSLGILAQVIAAQLKLPAILPLLVAGMVAGPFGIGVLHPDALGPALEVTIHLGVAIILFEGGLSLEPRQLRQVGGAIRNLLTIGALVTGAGGAWLMRACTGASWSTAALFGAIVTVTGPTVIQPLLRHMIAPRKVRTTLLSEGLMIDPIGAVLAYLVLQWIDRANLLGPTPLLKELFALCLTGAVLGFVAGSLAAFVIRHRHMSDELGNLVILAVLLASFLVSERQAPQSGVIAAVVMGLTVSAAKIPDLNPLKVFKGQLTVLVISVLFVLLSGRLDLGAMYQLGWSGLAVVAGLILVVRPLAVLVSVPPRELGWKERVMLALNAPRGIVAAAVASLASIRLRDTGSTSDAVLLEGLVYLVILVTCLWSTAMAKLLPRFLGYLDDPNRRCTVLVGAGPLSGALAQLFRSQGWNPVVVDSAPRKLALLRSQKVRTVLGDARDAATYEEAGVERDSLVLALTPNDELNLLVAQLVRADFSVEHPAVALQQPSNEFGRRRHAWIDLLSGESVDVMRWSRLVEDGAATFLTVTLDDRLRQELRSLLREMPHELSLLCGWGGGGRPSFRCHRDDLDRYGRITLVAWSDEARKRLEELEGSGGQPAGVEVHKLAAAVPPSLSAA